MKNCILCGEELKEGKCPTSHSFKKMCINCKYAIKNEDGTEFKCGNKKNLDAAIAKIKADLMSSAENVNFDIENFDSLKISARPLKKPLLKCGQWELSEEVVEQIKTLFA